MITMELTPKDHLTKEERYTELLLQAHAVIDPECGWVANYANICALIQSSFSHLWCGFYFVNGNGKLELGPFQGPVACTLIGYGKGVCGKAWKDAQTIVVPDVHQFDGHIACSGMSNSEIVVPIVQNGTVIGVLDIDSIHFGQFDNTDQLYLEKLVQLLAPLPVKF